MEGYSLGKRIQPLLDSPVIHLLPYGCFTAFKSHQSNSGLVQDEGHVGFTDIAHRIALEEFQPV